jgi:hypothetical protein
MLLVPLVLCPYYTVVCGAGASAAQPGLRINLSRGSGNLLRQFPDALTPYMHFGCSMEVSQGSQPFDATIKQCRQCMSAGLQGLFAAVPGQIGGGSVCDEASWAFFFTDSSCPRPVGMLLLG